MSLDGNEGVQEGRQNRRVSASDDRKRNPCVERSILCVFETPFYCSLFEMHCSCCSPHTTPVAIFDASIAIAVQFSHANSS